MDNPSITPTSLPSPGTDYQLSILSMRTAIFGLAQSLWFAFTFSLATKRSQMAAAAWLEIALQIGLGIAALVGGRLAASESCLMLGILSSATKAVISPMPPVMAKRISLPMITMGSGFYQLSRTLSLNYSWR